MLSELRASTSLQTESLLDHLDFQIGLDEFTRTIEKYKQEYLVWPTTKDIVEWVKENIELQQGETSRHGQMELTVYQREIARGVTDPAVKQITVLKGVQIGYSKVLKAIYAYVISYLNKRCSVVFPTKDNVKRFWKDEIVDMYRSVKALKKLIREIERGGAANTTSEQRFINGAIGYFRSAFKEDDLQSFTCEINMADEVDREGWQPRAGSAGNKLNQLRNRGVDLKGSKLLVGSTPGLRHTSVIWAEWLLSDQRRLRVNCPHCGTEQELRWGGRDTRYGFKYKCDDDYQVIDAFYQCDSEKQCRIDQDDRDDMVDAGRYVPTVVAKKPGNIGIHVPSWISPSPGAAWIDICQKWVLAQDDPELMREFVCFWMGEPWDEFDSRALTEGGIKSNMRNYPAEVPDDVVVLTAGGDDQTNKEGNELEKLASREVSIVGFNRRKEPRLIGHWVILGEVGDPDADEEYRKLLARPFRKRDGTEMYVQSAAMDEGGDHTNKTRIFGNSFPKSRNVFVIKGHSVTKGMRKNSLLPSGNSTSGTGLRFYMVDTQRGRDIAGANLVRLGDNAPMFPSSVPDDYFEKLTCEHQVKQKNGGYWWTEKKGRRSEEEWACFVYAHVALEFLQQKRRVWRNLNLAADKLGILPTPHDPVTGEVLEEPQYEGPDLSAMASAGSKPASIATATPSGIAQRAIERRLEAQRQEPTAVPKVVGVKPMVRKRRSGGVISF